MGTPSIRRANEVKRSLERNDRSKLLTRLEKRGYKMIGSGMFSYVMAKPGSDRCVKIGMRDAWPEYIAWATERGYAGTFAPKVFRLVMFKHCYMAEMEMLVTDLRPMVEGTYGKIVRCDALDDWRNVKRHVDRFRNEPTPDLLNAFCHFVMEAKRDNLVDDTHDGNFMLRKDGQLVMTDPISRSPLIASTRIRHGTVVGTTFKRDENQPPKECLPTSRKDVKRFPIFNNLLWNAFEKAANVALNIAERQR